MAGVKIVLERFEVDDMLVQSCAAVEVGVMKCSIEHNVEGMRCFARQQFL